MEQKSTVGKPLVHGFTIDNPDTDDQDDGIYVFQNKTGYELVVSIADTTKHIIPGSSVDLKAREQGFTQYGYSYTDYLYGRDLTYRMRLYPGEPRPGITFRVQLPHQGEATLSVQETEVKTFAKLTYSQAGKTLAIGGAFHGQLKLLCHVAAHLPRRRAKEYPHGMERIMDSSDILIHNGGRGTMQKAIGECMLITNELAAAYFTANGLSGIFRNCETQSFTYNESEYRANYAHQSVGHSALGFPGYLQVTSPIRRYGDSVNIRVLSAHLNGQASPYNENDLADIAHSLNVSERGMWSKVDQGSLTFKMGDYIMRQ